MDWALLAQALVQLLSHAPELFQAVEDFWNELHANQRHAATMAPHADAVRDAIADARQRAGQAQRQP